VLISGLTSGFEKESVHSFANLSKQVYSYDEITGRFFWCKMGDRMNYFARNGCQQNYTANEVERYCFRPRDFDETKDFRLLSSPRRSAFQFKTKPCNDSLLQRDIAFFMHRMYLFFYQNLRWCPLKLHEREGYFKASLEANEKIKNTGSQLRKLEEEIFNLIYPAHNGLPVEALNLLKREDYYCVLHDAVAYENIVEEELVKCEKTAYADVHTKILLQVDDPQKK